MDIDFKTMREAFRAVDNSNSGIITLEQMKKGFKYDSFVTFLDNDFIEKIFKRFDFNKSGKINYSDFLAATVDKKQALTKANL